MQAGLSRASRARWIDAQLFRTRKPKGFGVEASRVLPKVPSRSLPRQDSLPAVTVLQRACEREGAARRPLEHTTDKERASSP
jgi:hypothetical protein